MQRALRVNLRFKSEWKVEWNFFFFFLILSFFVCLYKSLSGGRESINWRGCVCSFFSSSHSYFSICFCLCECVSVYVSPAPISNFYFIPFYSLLIKINSKCNEARAARYREREGQKKRVTRRRRRRKKTDFLWVRLYFDFACASPFTLWMTLASPWVQGRETQKKERERERDSQSS